MSWYYHNPPMLLMRIIFLSHQVTLPDLISHSEGTSLLLKPAVVATSCNVSGNNCCHFHCPSTTIARAGLIYDWGPPCQLIFTPFLTWVIPTDCIKSSKELLVLLQWNICVLWTIVGLFYSIRTCNLLHCFILYNSTSQSQASISASPSSIQWGGDQRPQNKKACSIPKVQHARSFVLFHLLHRSLQAALPVRRHHLSHIWSLKRPLIAPTSVTSGGFERGRLTASNNFRFLKMLKAKLRRTVACTTINQSSMS